MNNQKIFLNQGLSKLNSILDKLKAYKIFIVCGNNSFLPISSSIKKQLKIYNTYFFNTSKISTTIDDLYKGIKEFNNFKPDIIIAIGGGSVIDMAKLIKTLAKEKNILTTIIENKINLKYQSKIPFIVMPTTAGSGSESTSFSVIFHEKTKYSLVSEAMLPDFVILDVELVKGMPKNIAYCSLFDSLCQAIESYWSKFATNLSDEYALESIKIILENFNDYVSSRSNENLTKIIQASNLSGAAINITKTTAPHALSYALTSYFQIPHGNAVAILLPETFKLSIEKMMYIDNQKCSKILSLFESNDINSFCEKWWALMKACNLSTKARQFGVNYSDVEFIASKVNLERLKGHPIELTKFEIKKIVNQII